MTRAPAERAVADSHEVIEVHVAPEFTPQQRAAPDRAVGAPGFTPKRPTAPDRGVGAPNSHARSQEGSFVTMPGTPHRQRIAQRTCRVNLGIPRAI
jgi:hypothetical protein